MAHFEVTHSAYFDTRINTTMKAGSLIVNGETRAADLIRRLTNSGATDAKATELTSEQHQAQVASRLPPFGK